MTRSAARRNGDLTPRSRPVVNWDDDGSLVEVYDWAQQVAQDAIDWYLTEKKRKARWSRGLRAAAAILTVLGGVIPVAALTAGRPELGNGGFIMLALAAGCLAYDRFFGYSSSWLRYVAAATKLRAQLNDFQLSWLQETLPARHGPAPGDPHSLIELVREFVRSLDETIRQETDSWLVEFHTRMAEQESKSTPPQPPPTSANAEYGGFGGARV
ncbi:SLATT domain-containing protein [Amycolatopsis sp. NPDC098790]|uniref:SLATT domain-containing protein n=1 Tax=Amycolatopsis sp. NPDC098790 TaxID=3363939 RepID=UPI00382F0C82